MELLGDVVEQLILYDNLPLFSTFVFNFNVGDDTLILYTEIFLFYLDLFNCFAVEMDDISV